MFFFAEKLNVPKFFYLKPDFLEEVGNAFFELDFSVWFFTCERVFLTSFGLKTIEFGCFRTNFMSKFFQVLKAIFEIIHVFLREFWATLKKSKCALSGFWNGTHQHCEFLVKKSIFSVKNHSFSDNEVSNVRQNKCL